MAIPPLRMDEGSTPEVVTRQEISVKTADSQSGGTLAVYVVLKPKLEALFAAVAGSKDAVISAEQLTSRECRRRAAAVPLCCCRTTSDALVRVAPIAVMSSVGEDLSEEEVADLERPRRSSKKLPARPPSPRTQWQRRV